MIDPARAEGDDPADAPAPTTARPGLRDVPWRWSDVGISLAILLVMLAYPALAGPAAMRRWWLVLTLLVLGGIAAYPLAVAGVRVGLPRWPRPRAWLIEGGIALVVAALLFAGMMGVAQFLARSAGGSDGPVSPFDPLAASADRPRLMILAALAVLVGPACEEIYFRGMLYNALRQRTHPVIAAVLQAAVFGLVHPFDVAYRAAIAVVGFVLAMVYEWRKTLLTPILVHALANAASFATILLAVAAYDRAPVLGVGGERGEGGCRITELMPGGAAEEAGLRVGDVITVAGEYSVADLRDVRLVMLSHKPGDRIPVVFRRGEEEFRTEAILKARPR